jgi:hypothetical protein
MIRNIVRIGVAQKSFPRYIFKYRQAEDDNTKRIITDNELWFSNPLLFNDPYDCNIPISSETSLDDIRRWLDSISIAPDSIDSLSVKLKENPNFMSETTRNAISKLGVCCFSTMDDSILQWSHYSNYHKGICLKFDLNEDSEFFLTPVIVSYRKLMQHYNHFCHSKNIVDYLIKPKFYEWCYESEIRIVKTSEQISNNSNSRAFKFKDEALKEVIFGTNTPEPVITHYKQLCQQNDKSHIQFYKMKLGSGTHYKLIKKSI